jgi:hypothetical protein
MSVPFFRIHTFLSHREAHSISELLCDLLFAGLTVEISIARDPAVYADLRKC